MIAQIIPLVAIAAVLVLGILGTVGKLLFDEWRIRRAMWLPIPIVPLLSQRPQMRRPIDRLPNATDLTPPELASLHLVARGFMSRTIPKVHQLRLIQLGLIQSLMGGLMVTPIGRMVGRV